MRRAGWKTDIWRQIQERHRPRGNDRQLPRYIVRRGVCGNIVKEMLDLGSRFLRYEHLKTTRTRKVRLSHMSTPSSIEFAFVGGETELEISHDLLIV